VNILMNICFVASKLKDSEWNYADYEASFMADMESVIAQKRVDELKRVAVSLQVCLVDSSNVSHIYHLNRNCSNPNYQRLYPRN
jgi:hypothetical protein